MKMTLFMIVILMLSCNTTEDKCQKLEKQLSTLQSDNRIELNTEKMIKDYIRDLNDPDWPNKIGPYLRNIEFIDEHKIFRETLTNYHFEIKHLVVSGTEGILWGVLTANHSKEFQSGELKGIPADDKEINWDEVWRFTVDGKKFGEGFELIKSDGWRESFGL